MYPILGSGLNVECKLIGSDKSIPFRSSEKTMPRIPPEEDNRATTQYAETIKLVPHNRSKTLLNRGTYVINVTHDSADLMKYFGGTKLSSCL